MNIIFFLGSRCIPHRIIKTLPFPTFRRILRHCVLIGGIQRRPLPRYQSEKITILNILIRLVGIEPTMEKSARGDRKKK